MEIKKAENEDELSSESLVRILEKDLQLLKESDFQALSNHFRSKSSVLEEMQKIQTQI